MPDRTYVGPHQEVEVPLPDGSTVNVKKGSSGEFPDDVAKDLDASGAWATKTEARKTKEED